MSICVLVLVGSWLFNSNQMEIRCLKTGGSKGFGQLVNVDITGLCLLWSGAAHFHDFSRIFPFQWGGRNVLFRSAVRVSPNNESRSIKAESDWDSSFLLIRSNSTRSPRIIPTVFVFIFGIAEGAPCKWGSQCRSAASAKTASDSSSIPLCPAPYIGSM